MNANKVFISSLFSLSILTSPLGTTFGSASTDVYPELLKKAAGALEKKDHKSADFYLARYVGLASRDTSQTHGVRDIAEVLEKRDLPPKAFIPGDWDAGFLTWFETSLYDRWGTAEERSREKGRSMEIAHALHRGRFFITVVANPLIERWHALQDGVKTRSMLLFMGGVQGIERPSIFFGRMLRGKPSPQFNVTYLDTKHRPLHYLWTPEFYDLDKDGTPEVWVRYNTAWGNGFAQVLEVYLVKDESHLELIQRFQGDNGIARRLPDGRVETAVAVDRKKSGLPLYYDTHQFSTWSYEKGAFKKDSEEDRPFLFKGSLWRPYFMESDSTPSR